MQALDLNLASRPFKNNTLLWAGYISSCVLLVGFSAWNVLTWRESVSGLERLRNQVSNVEVKMSDLDRREGIAQRRIDAYDLRALEIQAAKANEVIEWKAFSWTRLFNRIEKIQPYNVRMTSIRPLFRAGRRADQQGIGSPSTTETVPVAVEGLAKEFSHVRELQDALHADPHFGRVMPQRMQRTDRGEILFQLTFLYHPHVRIGSEQDAQDAQEALSAEAAAAEADQPEQAADSSGSAASAEGDAEEPPAAAEPTAAEELAAEGAEQGEVALAGAGGPAGATDPGILAAKDGAGVPPAAPGATDGGPPAAAEPAAQPSAVPDNAEQNEADKQLQNAPAKPPRRQLRRPRRSDRQDEKKEKQEDQ